LSATAARLEQRAMDGGRGGRILAAIAAVSST
jgi:hypothetical protein